MRVLRASSAVSVVRTVGTRRNQLKCEGQQRVIDVIGIALAVDSRVVVIEPAGAHQGTGITIDPMRLIGVGKA
ncbi:MAG: hypothetical protein R3F37_22105 [Candidatus Competibacteraceae bacterium]